VSRPVRHARLPLRPGTVEAAIEGNLPLITKPAASSPTCCTQATVEPKEDGQRKIWQKFYCGTREHTLSYNRRTRAEGVFGNLKNRSTESISRGSFRITELARVTLFLGIGVPALNVRQYPQLASAAWSRRRCLPVALTGL
jgi:hypothetical protein